MITRSSKPSHVHSGRQARMHTRPVAWLCAWVPCLLERLVGFVLRLACVAVISTACSETRLLAILDKADSGRPHVSDAGSNADAGHLLDAGSTPDAGAKPCYLDGIACGHNSDCCSETCYDEGSGQVCLKRSACHPTQDHCIGDKDCCSGVCDQGFCAKVWLSFCRIIGEPCSSSTDCCSGICADTGHGALTCQALGGCRPIAEVCSRPSDCCSNRCDIEPSGVGSCRPDGDCFRQGELCMGGPIGGPAPGCCDSWQNGPAERAFCVPTDTSASRCMIQSDCDPDGTRCRLPEQCCSGYCVPDSRGDLTCAAGCVPKDAACQASRDCCTGLCVDGQCHESGVECKQIDLACTSDSQCCSGYCRGHGGTSCSAPPPDDSPPRN